ncbi:cation diffusion facilitator family transporter [Atopobium fossor]|uniref:cation diffusion facilitator family transporter n=1 Tax=Atopobium fossor TaxID=39487 RepID=UPI0004175D7B|nr:cation diffusion facilitator family transporter [Atopobium fossor]
MAAQTKAEEQTRAAFSSSLSSQVRQHIIVRTSIVGIAANILLAVVKAFVGTLSGSIAITLDAVNNLSDALSSVITIVGTKLAGRPANKAHPYGYGRIEYLTATIISLIVLYAGITSLIESGKTLSLPTQVSYSIPTLIVIVSTIVVKLVLGTYVKSTGKRVDSDSLVASGSDALFDAVLTASTLFAALMYLGYGIDLTAWVGLLIAGVIVKAGFDMLSETLSQILGERIDADVSRQIKEITRSAEGVLGVYDLDLHNYGPTSLIGSIHIELADTKSAAQIDELTRKIQHDVYEQTNGRVILAAVGIYSQNTTDDEAKQIRSEVTRLVMAHDNVIQMHGFHLDKVEKRMSFDIIIDFGASDRQKLFDQIISEVQQAFPTYRISAVLDVDTSD